MKQLPLLRGFVLASLLCLSGASAFAEFKVSGYTEGSFYLGPLPLGDTLAVPGIIYNDTNFGPTTLAPPASTTLNLGSFGVYSLLGWFDPLDFKLSVIFTAPVGAGSATFIADLQGTVSIFGGSVKVDFDNTPRVIAFSNSYGSGSFTLDIQDVIIPNGTTRSVVGNITNAAYSASVPEPFAVTALAVNLLALGIFALVVRRRHVTQ